MDDVDLADRCDRNFWHTFKVLAALLPGGAVREGDGVLIASWGAPVSFFNPVFVTDASVHPSTVLEAAHSFFDGTGLPFVVRCREDLAGDLPDRVVEDGLKPVADLPAMAMDPIPDTPPLADGLALRSVEGATGLADHCRMLSEGFGMPLAMVTALFPESLVGAGVVPFVGYFDGQPVCSSALTVSGDTAGVYNVATPDAHRRRGFGEAATWHAIAEGRAVGCTNAILQASDMGRPIYERMGFRTVATYLQWEATPSALQKDAHPRGSAVP